MDQKKLLYLVSTKGRIRKDNGNIIWLKELSLLALVFEGISRRIFENYDYAPSLVNFKGVKLYANVSQEYLLDIDILIQKNFIEKLKLNTKYYDNITAYSVSHRVNEIIQAITPEIKEMIDHLMTCPKCDTMIKVFVDNRKAFIICPECNYKRETGFFNIENVPYHSVAFFSGGGR
jgi:hypothetical protein